jgi:hypothetical protein
MPDDSVIRIRQTLDLTDFKAKSAESRAIVAAQVAELKGQYAQAAIEARATLTDLAHAEKTFGAEAEAGNQKATETLEQHREMVAEARAEYARLGGQLATAKEQLAQIDAQARGAASGLNALAAAGKTAGAGLGSSFATAKVEAGVLTDNIRATEMGLARLALGSETLGPLMRAALPVAIFAAIAEMIPQIAAGIHDWIDALRGLQREFATQMHEQENYHKAQLEDVKLTEATNKARAAGAEGLRKYSIEIGQNARLLDEIHPKYDQAKKDVETLWQTVEDLEERKAKMGILSPLDETELKHANEQLAETRKWFGELQSVYDRLNSQSIILPAQRAADAEKESLNDRRAAIEAVAREEQGTHQLTLEYIETEAERARELRDQAVAGALAQFDRIGAVRAQEAQSETQIADWVLQAKLNANQSAFKDAVEKIEALMRLTEEHGRATGTDVKPELAGLDADAEHAKVERGVADMAAWAAAYKGWAKDAKESGDAVTRMLADVARAQEQDSTAARELAKKEFEERIRDIKEEAKLEIDTRRAMLDETLRTMNIDRQMSIGKAQEEIALVRQAAAEEIRIRAQEAAQLRAMGVTDAAQYKAIQDQKVQIARQAARQIEDIQRQEYQQLKQVFDEMASTFNTALNQMITHQRTFAQAAREMWNGLVMDVIKQIEKMVEQWIAQHVIMAVIHKVFAAQTAAVDTSATATKVAQNNAANVAIGLSDAAVGAAAAFASVIEALPFPANIAAAPPVAAGVYATIAGMASAGSFEHGGIIPGPVGMPTGVTAHGGEMFLGTKLSQTVQNLASSGGSTRAGATNHVRMNINPTFISRTEFSDSDIRNHSKEIARAVKNEWAQFNR